MTEGPQNTSRTADSAELPPALVDAPAAPFLVYALAKPGAWQDEPWEGDPVAKVGPKIFAFFGGRTVGLKCGRDREEADELLVRYPGRVEVMAYIGRYGWNRVTVDGSMDQEDVFELIDASYQDVVARLPRKHRPT